MVSLKFDKNGNLIPQKVKYKPKRDEETEEMLDKYIRKNADYQIDYDSEGNAIFSKKEKNM